MKRKLLLTLMVSSIAALSGCGGGGGGAATNVGTSNITLNATPALGAFTDGATVIISDSSGKECNRGKTVGGVASITINPNTCIAPLIVQAGIAGDMYFNEATGLNVALVGSGVRAVLPDTTRTSFGVTALTEISAAGLLSASGVVNTNATGVTARNMTISALITRGNVPDPLAVPQAAGLGTQAKNAYGAILAFLANLVPGSTAESISNGLAADLADGAWDGFIGNPASAVPALTPSAATFGASMVAAVSTAASSVNAISAPTIVFTNYTPASGITAAVTSTNNNNGVFPITTAKNLFTSLRTSMNMLANTTQTGFYDTQALAAKNDLRNTVMPSVNGIRGKVDVMNSAITLMDSLKTSGIAGLPACLPAGMFMLGSCQMTDPANVLNTIVQSQVINFNRGLWVTCSTSVPSTFVAGVLPVGIVVACNSSVDTPAFTPTGITTYTFNVNVSPAATTNNYTYISSTSTQQFSFGVGVPSAPVIGASYAGTATVVPMLGRANSAVTINGQLAADGVSHAYDQVSISSARTYPSGATPAATPVGFALAKYDFTGSIGSVLANGTTTGTILLLAGSSATQLEDVNGNVPATAAAGSPGKTVTVVLKANTTNTQIDGTVTVNNYAVDLSGTSSFPTSLSFTGSLTNLANLTVGKFATGTLTDTRDYTAYDSTLPTTSVNRFKDVGSFSGVVTDNTTSPASVYQLTVNDDTTVINKSAVSFIYKDPSNNTVTANAVIDTTPGPVTPAYTINVTSGSVIGKLFKAPAGFGASRTAGLTGNLYVGSVAPANLIGTLNGTTINYADGTFASLF